MPTTRAIVGVDLRVTSVKVVEIEKAEGTAILKNWGLTEVPYFLVDKHPQKEDAQAEALRKLIKTRSIKTKDAVVVVGGDDVVIKLFSLTEVSKAEVAEAIKWKFAEEIPFPIEEALIDYYPLTQGKEAETDKTDYLAACINKNYFTDLQYIVNKAGLRLTSVVILPDALEKLFEADIGREKDRIISLIYIGKRTTNISIIRNGNLEFNRELNIGGENITLAMSGVLVSAEGRVEINPQEAEKIKVEHGVPIIPGTYDKLGDIPISQLQSMVRPALERIQEEIMRTFEYYKGQTGEAGIAKVILTGGSALTKNLPGFLADGLGTEVLTSDGMAGRSYDNRLIDRAALKNVMPRLAAAFGAALSAGEKINLLPEDVKYRWKLIYSRLSKPQYLAGYLASILIISYTIFWFQGYSLGKEVNDIDKKLSQYKPRIAVLDQIQRTAAEEGKRNILLKSYQEKRMRIPQVFREISRQIPDSISLRSIDLSPSEIKLFGVSFKKDEAAENVLSRFVLSLSSSKYFKNVKLINASRSFEYATDAFNFEITADLKLD